MIGLVRHIEYLLLHNDDVFIPGLGRFTVLCDEAKIQSGGTSFLPPVKKVAFESVATGDSGLLVRSVMRAGFISWDEAVEAIAEEVESVYKHLEQGGDYGFGRLGRLVLVDGNVCFQPQENNSIENPRFGFTPLEITPREEDVEDREIPTVEAEKVRDRVYISFHRRTVRAAAVAAAIIVFLSQSIHPIPLPIMPDYCLPSYSVRRILRPTKLSLMILNPFWESMKCPIRLPPGKKMFWKPLYTISKQREIPTIL